MSDGQKYYDFHPQIANEMSWIVMKMVNYLRKCQPRNKEKSLVDKLGEVPRNSGNL